jgi:hypothetical protein
MTKTGKLLPLKQFTKLDVEKRKIKLRLKAIEAEMDALQDPIKEMFEQMEMTNTKIGDVTVYLKRDIWVGRANEDVTGEQLASALRAGGLEDYVRSENMNIQSISAWLREQLRDSGIAEPGDLRELMPVDLRPLIKISDNFSVSTRKS